MPCSRQCSVAPSTADRDRRAPWRKNSTAMATSLPIPTQRAASPPHGSITASTTTATIAAVKLSGSSRNRLLILRSVILAFPVPLTQKTRRPCGAAGVELSTLCRLSGG